MYWDKAYATRFLQTKANEEPSNITQIFQFHYSISFFIFMTKFFLSLQVCIAFFSINSFAQTSKSPSNAKFLIEGGIEYGGDEILKVYFINGGDQTMKAGQGGFISVGGEFQSPKMPSLLLRTTIGIKYNTTAADNANIRLTRIPINVVGYWKATKDVRLGIGATSHQNVKFKGDGFVDDIDFTSSIGPRFEVGYKWCALTYTSTKYKNQAGKAVSASSLGLSVSFTFPNK